jgi:hypothetical protein
MIPSLRPISSLRVSYKTAEEETLWLYETKRFVTEFTESQYLNQFNPDNIFTSYFAKIHLYENDTNIFKVT